jgi:cytochrome c oxidase subunit I
MEARHEAMEADRTQARAWVLLAALSLMLAGALSLLLVVARTPPLDRLVGDPLFFKRALVVHVDLSIVVWFYAFIAGLFRLLPARGRSPLARVAPPLALVAMGVLVTVALVPGVQPLLSNYVPMLDHPLFAAGLLLFAVAIALALVDPRLLPHGGGVAGTGLLPEAALPAVRGAAVAVLLALATFFVTWLHTPRSLPAADYYEALYWGGGHILQFASVAAMLACWVTLLTPVLGRAPLHRKESAALAALLVVPVLSAPLLALKDPTGPAYLLGFTRLMQFGIFPAVVLALGLCVRALVQAGRRGALAPGWARDARLWAFGVSACLTVLGFVLGALIRGSTTMVPAHYHAAIGAVTAAFMAVTYHLLAPFGMPLPTERLRRLARVQPVLYGSGQAIFATGMALAGAHGMGRKTYGAEQVRRTLAETVGMGVMGLGGLVAILGGVLFLVLVVSAWRASARTPERADWPLAEGTPSAER